jgi:acyl dehydratase
MSDRVSVDAQVGDRLPVLSIPITTRLIVAGAIASRDYQDVHHDKDAARALGSPDIFMNILTTNGLVGRYITDWAGSSARLRKLSIQLGTPNFPGDTMQLSGEVVSRDAASGVIEVQVEGSNQLGVHVTGTVLVLV